MHGMQVAFTKQVSARQSLRVGGDVNFERLTSEAFNVNPVTGSISPRRPRIPDGAEFTQGGVYAQTTVDVTPERFRLVGSLRFGGAKYHAEAGSLWPADALTTSSATFRVGGVLTPSNPWAVLLTVSRGFRAPHMTDLGTLGLTGSGFEVAALMSRASAVQSEPAPMRLRSRPESKCGRWIRRHRCNTKDSAIPEPAFPHRASMFVNNIYDIFRNGPHPAPGPSVSRWRHADHFANANGAVFVAATTCRCSCGHSTTRGSGGSSTVRRRDSSIPSP